MSGIEAVLAAVARQHQDVTDRSSDDGCSCGYPDPRTFADHLAEVQAAEVRAWLAGELAGEGLREAVAATFSAPEHAPMSDHDYRTGECQTCPWPAREVLSDTELATAALTTVRAHLTGEASK